MHTFSQYTHLRIMNLELDVKCDVTSNKSLSKRLSLFTSRHFPALEPAELLGPMTFTRHQLRNFINYLLDTEIGIVRAN